jgi:5-formyltetrahydrofolate cyclo-ligase
MTELLPRKAELRAAIDRLRRGIPAEEIEARSRAAAEVFLALPPVAASRFATVALYLPLPGELGTEAVWEALVDRGVRCVFPRVEKGSRVLRFFPLRPGEPVERGPLGVRQPPARDEVRLEAIEAFLVPGQAFDAQGGRLGRGGGYYDSTLASAPWAERIGFGFDEQLLPSVPMLPHDVPLDWVVTPERGLRCEPGRSRPSPHGPW